MIYVQIRQHIIHYFLNSEHVLGKSLKTRNKVILQYISNPVEQDPYWEASCPPFMELETLSCSQKHTTGTIFTITSYFSYVEYPKPQFRTGDEEAGIKKKVAVEKLCVAH
jgi:hypothetical protein